MSGIRGRWARIVREQQHEESERRAGPPLLGPASAYGHQESIAPVRAGKTFSGRLEWRVDGPYWPSLFVVKP